ncbi:GNAT family N-acetyltransferase [Bacillus sp. AFS015802]|uniref:GNAT family N-acetyltransferase n=1 Tax=Bacillus sp. AFS015802 TaxID=2033486 RepID=UPI000BF9DAD6|nr:GNAT family N-acetyltransferase [Bacillus sp. AFS015802]PFA69380.1 GNAT family N-acetyltransferase [Bacillus sp. AFS015802]
MYMKEQYVFRNSHIHKAVIRNYSKEDFNDLISLQRCAFPPPFPSELLWNKDQLAHHLIHFPLGALCVEIDGKFAGSMTSLIVDFDPLKPQHTWEDITDHGYIRTHNENGDTLYVVDLCIDPEFRGFKLGKVLMNASFEIVVHLQLDRLLGGGRIPTYHKVAKHFSIEEYIEKLTSGEYKDPVITFLLQTGRTPLTAVKGYLEDEESCDYGVLMEWQNPFKHSLDVSGEKEKGIERTIRSFNPLKRGK